MRIIHILFIIFASCTMVQAGQDSVSPHPGPPETRHPDFRVTPYIQNPGPGAVSVLWFSNLEESGEISYREQHSGHRVTLRSFPERVKSLGWSLADLQAGIKGRRPSPCRHRVRLTGLKEGMNYAYEVKQGISRFSGQFSIPSREKDQVRFVVLADTETEPESRGKFAQWGNPDQPDRKYLIDQHRGMVNNLLSIARTAPEFVILAGDLVESGGEQRDWDEFWKHFSTLASRLYLFPAPGNHEYFAGPLPGRKTYQGYSQPHSEYAVGKYLTYFETPRHGPDAGEKSDRYYSIRYGPVSLIFLDSSSGGKQGSEFDTSEFLLSSSDEGGGGSPSISPGSPQHQWLEQELKTARKDSAFTFVVFHHAPYSSGIHGRKGEVQSGYPLRFLNELFMKYGVDAVFSGHDEMYERSVLFGVKIKPDGTRLDHSIQYYDIGIGGDGLRPPEQKTNPHQKFLAFRDSPEMRENGRLIEGGRHYGYLEVTVRKEKRGWKAVIEPVYLLPVVDRSGQYRDFRRHTYKDSVVLIKEGG